MEVLRFCFSTFLFSSSSSSADVELLLSKIKPSLQGSTEMGLHQRANLPMARVEMGLHKRHFSCLRRSLFPTMDQSLSLQRSISPAPFSLPRRKNPRRTRRALNPLKPLPRHQLTLRHHPSRARLQLLALRRRFGRHFAQRVTTCIDLEPL